MTTGIRLGVWLGALAMAVGLSACGSERQCGAGTRLEGDKCVPVPAALSCGEGTRLVDGVCRPLEEAPDAGEPACMRSCVGRVCGDDGCGGTCGTCDTTAAAPFCNELIGQCEATCVPRCAGRTCGDDGCGGTCGTCGAGNSCAAGLGRCVPDAWTCDAEWYGAGDACDCDCGTKDADCAVAGMPVAGCGAGETCGNDGACVSRVPAGWTCEPAFYDALDQCHCGCGVRDPDCDLVGAQVVGCGSSVAACNADGSCPVCTPDCSNKVCGDDGCGGLCGLCNDPNRPACIEGVCKSACEPSPIRCLTAECGDDECGGSCGTCAAGSSCQAGACVKDVVEVGPNSCVGRCGSGAPGGCYCTASCAASGSCCPDFADACSCTPRCDGKSCGSDGCNGSCGTCGGATPFCTDDGQCTATCTPDCSGKECGDDGCGGSCGSCGADETCIWTQQCLPKAWTCDPFLYGDRQGCDCGCGAPDSDCAATDATVYGCPSTTTECSAAGLCEVTFCRTNGSCTSGAWCVGGYLETAGRISGSCKAIEPETAPPGTPCTIGAQCATGLCLAGSCRQYCQQDSECPDFQTCLALPVRDPTTKALRGYAGVCELVAGSADACTSQATCSASGEKCIAVANAGTLAPRYLCADVRASALGRSCELTACPAGYFCGESSAGKVCTLPCPGGAADCPSGFTCGTVPFTSAGSSSPSMPACLRN